jgi:sulfatase modifying factor 1
MSQDWKSEADRLFGLPKWLWAAIVAPCFVGVILLWVEHKSGLFDQEKPNHDNPKVTTNPGTNEEKDGSRINPPASSESQMPQASSATTSIPPQQPHLPINNTSPPSKSEINNQADVTQTQHRQVEVAGAREIVNGWEGVNAGDFKRVKIGNQEIILRWCPPGEFLMGSRGVPDQDPDENQVKITLTNGFWMMETEVTQELYQAVTGQNPSFFKGSGKLPVEMVSWNDAQKFIKMLNETKAVIDQLGGYRFTLPTEAQWEYACRAGTTTATAFGDSLSSEQANFDGNFPYNNAAKGPYLGKTTSVGIYAANAWGLFDMHANVWEWCSDWYGDKLYDRIDPIGPSQAKLRVLRGGSWDSGGMVCRSAFRSRHEPDFCFKSLGFRLAAVL